METNNSTNGQALTSFLLKCAFAVIGAAGMGYAGYLKSTLSDHEIRVQTLEKALIGINTKLDLALKDIEFHHRSH